MVLIVSRQWTQVVVFPRINKARGVGKLLFPSWNYESVHLVVVINCGLESVILFIGFRHDLRVQI